NAAVYSRFVKQKMGMMMAQPSTQDLTLLAEMVQSGKLKTVIDRTYKSLSEVPDAIQYLEEGHARGKVIITVEKQPFFPLPVIPSEVEESLISRVKRPRFRLRHVILI